ncbi:fibronectin type III domain protein, partial [Teladorsagia circumcincta]
YKLDEPHTAWTEFVVEDPMAVSVPSVPPNNFRVENVVNFSTVSFKWEAVEESTVNGFFRGYEIEFWRDVLPARKYRIALLPNETEKVIATLAPNSNYTAVIRTKNRRYGSEPSPEVHLTTPEGCELITTYLQPIGHYYKEMEIGHQLENDEERQFLEYQYGYKS